MSIEQAASEIAAAMVRPIWEAERDNSKHVADTIGSRYTNTLASIATDPEASKMLAELQKKAFYHGAIAMLLHLAGGSEEMLLHLAGGSEE